MSLRVLLCCMLFAPAFLQADEQVRCVQEALRKRHLYFGDVDGRKTAETSGAIRRYQARKGLTETGELTGDTLRSLEIAAPSASGEEWPEGTVLKSDAARQISESDQKFLEESAGDELPPVAEAPQSAEAEIALKPPDAGAEETEPAPRADAAELTREFVRSYLAACESNELDAEMKFYADPISYLDTAIVDHAFVARDVQRFYKRWPQRRYELLEFKMTKTQGDLREVTFRIAFHYRNSHQSVAGQTMNYFKLRQDHTALVFTSLREQRVRN